MKKNMNASGNHNVCAGFALSFVNVISLPFAGGRFMLSWPWEAVLSFRFSLFMARYDAVFPLFIVGQKKREITGETSNHLVLHVVIGFGLIEMNNLWHRYDAVFPLLVTEYSESKQTWNNRGDKQSPCLTCTMSCCHRLWFDRNEQFMAPVRRRLPFVSNWI